MADEWDGLPNGNFAKWENEGDEIVGDVIGKGIGHDLQNNAVPELVIRLDNEEEVTVTASQAQLRAKLLEERPSVGDRVKITYTKSEKRDGGKTLKHFDLAVKQGGAKSAPAPEPADADDF